MRRLSLAMSIHPTYFDLATPLRAFCFAGPYVWNSLLEHNPATNINSCLQALTQDISAPADIAPSALETTISCCFIGYISALTYYLVYLIAAVDFSAITKLQAPPPARLARWTRLVSAPAVVWDRTQPIRRSRGVSVRAMTQRRCSPQRYRHPPRGSLYSKRRHR